MKKSFSKVVSFIIVLSLVMVSLSQMVFAVSELTQEEVSLTVTGQSTSSSTGQFDWVLVPGFHVLDHYMIDVDGAGFVDYSTGVNYPMSGLLPGSVHTITVQAYEMVPTWVDGTVPATLRAVLWLINFRFPGEWDGPGWYCTIDDVYVKVASVTDGASDSVIHDKGWEGRTRIGLFDTMVSGLVPGEPEAYMFISGSAEFTVPEEPEVPEEVIAPLYTVRVDTNPAGVTASFTGYGTGFANGAPYSVAIDSYDSTNYTFTGFSGSASGTIADADVQLIANFVPVVIELPDEEPIPEEPVEEPIEEVIEVVLDEEVAQDLALPDTGGVPMEAFSFLGIGLAAVGAKLRKKN